MAGTTDKNLDVDQATHTDTDTVAVAGPANEPEIGLDVDGAAAVNVGSDESAAGRDVPADLLEREGEAAADYLEGLLDIIDADGDIDMDVEGDRAVVSIIGDRLRHLVGPGGNVLDAIQELTRLAVARETGVRSRLMLDIGGHRARRRAELTQVGSEAAERALATGQPVRLDPMTAFERKVVHDAVAAAGQLSESEGVEPERRVVVLPATAGRPAVSVAAADGADTTSDS